MATPLVSGAVALYLSAKGNTKANKLALHALLSSTAVPAYSNDATASSPLNTVVQQGNGLLNIAAANSALTVIKPATLFLNDTAKFRAKHAITITNTGKSSVTYTLTHIGAGTATALSADLLKYAYPVPLAAKPATVKFSAAKVTVAAGKSIKRHSQMSWPTFLSCRQIERHHCFLRRSEGLEPSPAASI